MDWNTENLVIEQCVFVARCLCGCRCPRWSTTDDVITPFAEWICSDCAIGDHPW